MPDSDKKFNDTTSIKVYNHLKHFSWKKCTKINRFSCNGILDMFINWKRKSLKDGWLWNFWVDLDKIKYGYGDMQLLIVLDFSSVSHDWLSGRNYDQCLYCTIWRHYHSWIKNYFLEICLEISFQVIIKWNAIFSLILSILTKGFLIQFH